MSGHTPWRKIKRKAKTQKTENGLEIPVPKRKDVERDIRKLVQPVKKQSE